MNLKNMLLKRIKLIINYLIIIKKHFFRKFKLNTYTNSQNSEAKLITNFSNKYGLEVFTFLKAN